MTDKMIDTLLGGVCVLSFLLNAGFAVVVWYLNLGVLVWPFFIWALLLVAWSVVNLYQAVKLWRSC